MRGWGCEFTKTKLRIPSMDDFETEEKKQAAADVLFQYSRFVMVCIGEGIRPCDLRLHLMKEISGIQSTLKKRPLQAATSDVAGEPSSSGGLIGKAKVES